MISKDLKVFGLTHEQFNVLRILKGKHPEQMCVKDIATRMIEKSSNVPRILDRLEAKNFVLRSNSAVDKRETVMTLTPRGIEVLDEATNAIDASFAETIVIDEEKATMLNALLDQYRERE